MTYEAKNFDNLIGTEGFSDTLLQNHFKLYQGYVKNTNIAQEKVTTLEAGSYEYGEIKRRFGWEFNGMRLHELYFGNMKNGGVALAAESPLKTKITKQFGSFEAWEKDFRATGGMRGIGWVVLYYDKEGDQLINTWINEHDLGHLAGGNPLLVMDVFEHAFITDYGLNKSDYINAFFNAIDWNTVSDRM